MHRATTPLVLATVALATACTPPPPAPEGLDASSAYMVRNFYADDATFQAGVQGFMDWFENGGGAELTGLKPGEGGKESDAFTISDLTWDDVDHLPIKEPILTAPWEAELDDRTAVRDIAASAGVVSVAEMDCTWIESEDLLLRTDQDTVFPGDWDGYSRTYASSRSVYEQASEDGTYDIIVDEIDPFADDFDPASVGSTFLFTDNAADPAAIQILGISFGQLPEYPLDLDFRHGVYTLDLGDGPQQYKGFFILTYNRDAVWNEGCTAENNGACAEALIQSYSIEINIERPGDKTLRMLAVWAQPYASVLSPDDPIALNFAVSKSLNSSLLLSQICAGDVEVDPEPK